MCNSSPSVPRRTIDSVELYFIFAIGPVFRAPVKLLMAVPPALRHLRGSGARGTAHETKQFFRNAFPPGRFLGNNRRGYLQNNHTKAPPGWVRWCDRATWRTPASGACATGPMSRRATSAPSHRAGELPGPQAPGNQARLVHTNCTDCFGRVARMQYPGASVLCLSPAFVALLLARLAIRSGQSHQGLYTQPHQPGSG